MIRVTEFRKKGRLRRRSGFSLVEVEVEFYGRVVICRCLEI